MAVAARLYERIDEPVRRRAGRRVRRVRGRIAGKGARIFAIAAVPIALILLYVWLTAQLTAQTYRLHDDQGRLAALATRDNELRQQVAHLESLPRLEAAAAKLHMHVPSSVALVSPAHSAPAPPQAAFAASIADVRKWFGLR